MTQTTKTILISAVVGLCAAFIGVKAFAPDNVASVTQEESVYDRVMRTGVLRCGYYVFPPVTYRDPKTDELSGASVDIMETIGRRAGLTIEWTEEVTFGNWVPALQAKRFDAVCTPMWPEISMARAVAFTAPMFYAGLSPLVRADDERFLANDLARLNQEDVTFVTQDGNAIDELTRKNFERAIIRALPPTMEGPTVLQEIVTKKADAILLDRNAEIQYNKNNPVKLRLVAPDQPIKVQPFTLVVGREELIFKDFLDNAIEEMINGREIDRILKLWEPEPNMYFRAAQSYRLGE